MKMLFFFLLLTSVTSAQYTLTIKAEGLKSSEGLVLAGIYDSADSFLKDGKTFAGTFEVAEEGTTTISITDLPKGTYAASIFHDKNGNKRLDTNFMGIPKEPVAFSKAKMKTFGPPEFEECSFTLFADREISIPFR